MRRQLDLFGEAPPPPLTPHVTERDRELAHALPSHVRLGTSTWTFPGWKGLLYEGAPSQDALVRGGLGAYARHPLFRTVGIDRSYYGPLQDKDLEGYAAQLAGTDFLAVSKVWEELTTIAFPAHPRFGERAGAKNPSFLDPERTQIEVLAPYARHFADYTGPFVFEIPPAPQGSLPDEREFSAAIERLLTALPAQFRYAFELRNRELLTPRYLDTLRAHRATHCFNMWTAMPTVGRQLELPGVITSDVVVCRLMLPPATRYEAMKKAFEPFDRIVREQPDMRSDVVRLALLCEELSVKALFVLVNNKAEGSAPLTVKALAEAIVAARKQRLR
jgi:uncharacterized protein YecE (DUF72 family)